jgi:hypothetical protein
MTLAYDRTDGRLLGQVTEVQRPSIPEMLGIPAGPHITIFNAQGYLTVPESAVRIVKVD